MPASESSRAASPAFVVARLEPLELYMTPIHIDPERPAMPISHPRYYSSYLAKLLGPFATLGLAEDTWALNERALDEDGFLEQAYLFHEERERQLFDALDKTQSGVVVCVFDATDRIQHMFYRYSDADSRADRPGDGERYAGAVLDIYRRCDDLIGRVREVLDPRTVTGRSVGPRLRGVSPRRQSQRLVSRRRLSRAPRRSAGRRRVSARRRLEPHARLRGRPRRHVPESARARGAGHRRAGRGGGRLKQGDRRQARTAARPRGRPAGGRGSRRHGARATAAPTSIKRRT